MRGINGIPLQGSANLNTTRCPFSGKHQPLINMVSFLREAPTYTTHDAFSQGNVNSQLNTMSFSGKHQPLINMASFPREKLLYTQLDDLRSSKRKEKGGGETHFLNTLTLGPASSTSRTNASSIRELVLLERNVVQRRIAEVKHTSLSSKHWRTSSTQ